MDASGFNPRAMAALGAGSAVAVGGLVIPGARWLYDYAWFVGFATAFVVYLALMRRR
jgi:NCS1 family nucleobase:cation symporter-1